MINTWQDAIDAFNEYIDAAYAPKEVFDLSILTSKILRECDPIAYRTYLNDWLGSEGIDADELEGVNPL